LSARAQRYAIATKIIRAVKHLEAAEREDRVQALAEQSPEPLPTDLMMTAGFTAAVSTVPGVSTHHSDQWQLARFTPWDTTPLRFAAKLVRNLTLRV